MDRLRIAALWSIRRAGPMLYVLYTEEIILDIGLCSSGERMHHVPEDVDSIMEYQWNFCWRYWQRSCKVRAEFIAVPMFRVMG
eukprot:11640017-Ditylum_brightwellii.AAC.1